MIIESVLIETIQARAKAVANRLVDSLSPTFPNRRRRSKRIRAALIGKAHAERDELNWLNTQLRHLEQPDVEAPNDIPPYL